MGILVITVDLDCCRCRAKITKVLECLKDEFCIEKVEFEDKKEKKVVVVRGKFDPEKLCKKIWCKAGNKVVKEIIIVEVWPPPPSKPPPPKPCDPCGKCCGCEHCKPKCCVCERCKPKKPEEKKSPPPKPQVKFVPFPYPVPPGMCQSWPWQCPPNQQCQCCEKPPPRPPCGSCSSHGSCVCGQTPPACVWPPQPPGCVWPPQPPGCMWPPQPPVWPPTWPQGCNVDDEGQCSVM